MVDSERALEKAIEVSQKAVATLENVSARVPEVAKEYIESAKTAVQKHVEILENCLSRYRGGLVTNIREAMGIYEETLENYKTQSSETFEKMIKELGPRVK
jgi:nicotinamide mononucleotide (NMN) deamidase PncC